jgi:transposase InsO family protein
MSMKHDQVQELRAAIASRLNSGQSPSEIAQALDCSRTTVYKVLRLLNTPEALIDDGRKHNIGRPIAYSDQIWEIVLNARKADPSLGPIMLYHTLRRQAVELGFDPDDIPSPSSISEAIRAAGLAKKPIGPRDKRLFPLERVSAPGVMTIDSWGPWNCRGSRIYCITIQDRFTRLALALPMVGKRAEIQCGALKPTVTSWARAILAARSFLLPEDRPMTALYSDNGVGMSPMNGYLPQAARAALSVCGRIIYIPPAQPWRNGRLERFHWTMEREFWRIAMPAGFMAAVEGLTGFLNYYNVDRPHAALAYHSPAELAPWYKPLKDAWYDIECPRYDAPQRGLVEAVRIVHNTGEVELWGGDGLRISPVLAGQFVRVRFHVTGEPSVGQVVYCRKRDEELVVATFNHLLDVKVAHGPSMITAVELVDFDAGSVRDNEGLDEHQLANQRARISRRTLRYEPEREETTTQATVPDSGDA